MTLDLSEKLFRNARIRAEIKSKLFTRQKYGKSVNKCQREAIFQIKSKIWELKIHELKRKMISSTELNKLLESRRFVEADKVLQKHYSGQDEFDVVSSRKITNLVR